MGEASLEQAVRLNDEQIEHYRREGYVLVEGVLSAEALEGLRERLREYASAERDSSRLTFQVEARIAAGRRPIPRPGEGICRITGLVDHDGVFQQLAQNPNIMGIVQQLLGEDLKLFGNTVLMKPRRVGSTKYPHQHSPYWPIEPMDLCSCWLILDEAEPETNSIWVLPGRHRDGPLLHRGQGIELKVDPDLYEKEDLTALTVPPGAALFFHSLLPHDTAPSKVKQWRRAIALTYMSAASRYTGEGEGPVYFPVHGQTRLGCVR